ncbi:enhancer of polycomb homolog 2 isoform X1 [Stegostoma tigrinum]|uniref:enhancer of polycomb homolog 2 isoform X1 n=2 Tax=Stegostoma tigrinum TaxID=3053191 RepID=UPI002870329D|nr:enhancer of polycomb homolog 2 isoform X1 [Stegostoma tigrinum]
MRGISRSALSTQGTDSLTRIHERLWASGRPIKTGLKRHLCASEESSPAHTMSKLSFRARALDATKPLPIYRAKDLPDLQDCVSINRAVPQMPTGMEKEEESEHHLQRAISAQQVFREKRENMVIPVPEAESNVSYYDRLYRGEFKVPKQLIHIQPFNLDSEQPDYDMDSEDEVLFNRLNRKIEIKPLQFEEMFDRLEKASGNQLVSIQEARLLLKEDDYLIKAVYDYWARKRKNCRAPSLIPWVKQEKRDGSTNNDPYVAFRRRTEKMQTRKNRKNDEASYEKMLKLRREFSRAVTILEMIKRREKTKKDLLHLTLDVVEKRYHMGDFGGAIMSELRTVKQEKTISNSTVSLHNGNHYKVPEIKTVKQQQTHLMSFKEEATDTVHAKKKYVKKKHKTSECVVIHRQASSESQPALKRDIKQYDFLSSDEDSYTQVPSPVSEAEEDSDPDGHFAFRRKAGCQYYAPHLDQISTCPWETSDSAGLSESRYRYCLTTLTVPRRCIGLARRRTGRGGRFLLDRASTDHDHILHQIDPEMLSSPSSPAAFSSDDSWIISSNKDFSNRLSLSEILSNIKACRLRHFQPRLSPLQDSDDHSTSKKLGQNVNKKRIPVSSILTSSTMITSRNKISVMGGITEEQYHTHQQQLVQMQRQQLAQTQRQQAQHSSNITNESTQGSRISEGSSKTLDSASAHFAASAVVSAPRPGQADVSKDTAGHTSNMNGVVQTPGTYRNLQTSSATSSSSPGLSTVQIIRTVSRTSTNHVLPTLRTSSPQSFPVNNPCIGNAMRLNSMNVVTPVNVHLSARTSAPSPSALKLATAATNLDRVPKVTPSSAISSLSRESSEPDRLLNGIADKTVAMEVT